MLIDTIDISDQIVEHFVDKMTENEQTSAGERREFLEILDVELPYIVTGLKIPRALFPFTRGK